ncbi:sugar phosphate isomerase/epimerase [Paenibacillus sp. J2TS4]|uniref:sugar phosphate isomerase/epimerase family protein n=1 Tax=Paenibacillus sp. J2TS4 TaxID=2807194 RepID=UPI001B0F1B4F|nr:sugar phosphate isomerase/epimerase family protein [Paenibacillus sp. J2TS4]GIP33726.1 sugar phosphate isomerase [Paenibacillus sp. J2TS4]
MIYGLTRAGIGDAGSDEQFIEAAAEYGFRAIDGDPAEFVARLGAEGANAWLAKHNMAWSSCGLPVDWRTTDEAFRDGLTRLLEVAKAAAAIGCTSCCTYILPATDALPAPFMAQAIKRLRLCAQMLGAYGIRLGLEYVGPHHLRTQWTHPFLWTQEAVLDVIDAIGEPNVGLLLDSYHWYTTGLQKEDITRLRPEQIVHVHINDAPPGPVEKVLDNDRVYPGEGVIDLPAFLQALEQAGYQGAVTQEVLTKEPPKQTVQELLTRSKAGIDKVLAAAGLSHR